MSRTEMSETQVTSSTCVTSLNEEEALKAVPTNVPSILELKRILPKHCFQVTAVTSSISRVTSLSSADAESQCTLCTNVLCTLVIYDLGSNEPLGTIHK